MKSLIKVLVILVVFLSFNYTANAQRGERATDPKEMAAKQTTRMVKKLSLDEGQADKVEEINLTYAKKMHKAHGENKENRNAMKKVLDAINSEKSTEMKLVLTEAQFKSYEKMQAKEGKRRGGKDGGRRGGK